MLKENEIQEIILMVGSKSSFRDEPMKKHTTFRIGGPAKLFVRPSAIEQIIQVIKYCRQRDIPYFILGNGSNLLVSDRGFDGVVIQIYTNFNQIKKSQFGYLAQAGALLSAIAAQALKDEWTGFEFASGIPGTLGGAIMMNAGAYGGEMKQVVEEVTVLNQQGEIQKLSREQLMFGYRKSAIQERGDIVLEALLHFEKGKAQAIQNEIEKLRRLRIEKQPLEFPSAGSTFKRPKDNFAGKLIMEAGFRGYQVGGARVSDKHCGFVVNADNATAVDVIALTDQIKEKVKKEKGIELELEIKLLGEF